MQKLSELGLNALRFSGADTSGADVQIFRSDVTPPIPGCLEGDGLDFCFRQRYASFGLVDNCILTLDRETSWVLGAWVVTCVLQRRHYTYELQMGEWRLHLDLTKQGAEGNEHLTEWTWSPRPDLDEMISELPIDRDRPLVVLRNQEDFYGTSEQIAERDIVSISGSNEALLLFGEFFLDFGIESSVLNYEYIKSVLEPHRASVGGGLATLSSCELRVELRRAWQPHSNLDKSEW